MNAFAFWVFVIAGSIIAAPFLMCLILAIAAAWRGALLKAWDSLTEWTDGR